MSGPAVRSVVVRLSAEVSGLVRGYRQAKSESDNLNRSLLGTSKESEKARQGLTAVGNVAGGVGLAAAAGFGAAVAASANFDQAMSSVQAATHESAANMELLRAAALRAGEDTAYSATEAAAGVENLAKAGVSTTDILSGGLDGALSLAAAGNQSVADAAETAATAMTQFKLAGEDIPHIADLLAAGAGKAQGEVSDMAAALNQSGLVASQMGLSIEETTGALAAFAAAGLVGSDAGTSFKTMLLAATGKSEEASKAMDELGIRAYDAQGNFIGLEAWAGKLKTALGSMSAEQRTATLSTIFGTDAIRAANVLYEEGADGVRRWTSEVNDQGYAAETAAAKLDNLKGDLEEFSGALDTALINTGDGAQGPLRSLTQGATDLVRMYNELPSAAQTGVSGVLVASAVLGGGAFVSARTLQSIANTRQALTDLGGAGRVASRGLRLLSGATAVVGGVIALDSAVDGLLASMRDAPLATQQMTAELLKLKGAGSDTSALGKGFEDLGKSLDFFDEQRSKGGNLVDWIPNVTGLIPGWENAAEEMSRLEGEFTALDDALANIVQTGSAEQARSALDALAESAGLSKGQVSVLREQLPAYQEALAGVANDVALAAGSQEALTGATDAGTAANDRNTGSLRENVDAMREQRSLKLAALNAEVGYHAALDDTAAAIEENGRTIDLNTEKGRANRTALYQMAAAWNEQSAAAKNAPGAHRAAIRSFVDLAKRMGMSEDKARDLARRILELPSKRVRAELDASQAMGALSALDAYLDVVTRPRLVRITTVTNALVADQVTNRSGRAYGGPVTPYQRYRVGENGPEEFETSVPGRIIPTNQLGREAKWVGDAGALSGGGGGVAVLSDRQVDLLAERIGERVRQGALAGTSGVPAMARAQAEHVAAHRRSTGRRAGLDG